MLLRVLYGLMKIGHVQARGVVDTGALGRKSEAAPREDIVERRIKAEGEV